MESKKITKPDRGILLLSTPFVSDIFRRSVILIAEHNTEGSVGFIINKRSDYKLNDVVDDFPNFEAPVYLGGPVEQNMLNFIHKSGSIEGSIEICDGLYWGGEFESLKEIIESGTADPDDFRFILGYSGWGPGQLDTELEHDAWYMSKTDSEFVFETDSSGLWSGVLRRMGSRYKFMSTFPDDPSLN